jgi:hypothetical protein
MTPSIRLALACLTVLFLVGCPPVNDDDDDASAECNPPGDAAPMVTIQDPVNSLMLATDQSVNWVVQVEDDDSAVSDMFMDAFDMSNGTEVAIDFDIDSPASTGQLTFAMPQPATLGDGVITVRIKATDEVGCTGNDQVVLCIDVDAASCPTR